MIRKDCDRLSRHPAKASTVVMRAMTITLVACCAAPTAFAGEVRVWSTAVVVDDDVRLTDICELTGFDVTTERSIRDIIISEAPLPGGSRLIHADMVRAVLSQAGINMAKVRVRGATQCAISRPSRTMANVPDEALGNAVGDMTRDHEGHKRGANYHGQLLEQTSIKQTSFSSGGKEKSENTLRHAVERFFDRELARYGGRSEIVFDRTSAKTLELSGPEYEFNVRTRGAARLGLMPIEVDVLRGRRVVQTVPLMVQVRLIRRLLVAHRAINQNATVTEKDIRLVEISFHQVGRFGVDDPAQVIGQKARRFIPKGERIDLDKLESVPLVVRGQLVTLSSVVRGVRVVTTGKAAQEGRLGDVIRIRSVDNKRVEFDAVVVGPGQVQIGGMVVNRGRVVLAAEGGS